MQPMLSRYMALKFGSLSRRDLLHAQPWIVSHSAAIEDPCSEEPESGINWDEPWRLGIRMERTTVVACC